MLDQLIESRNDFQKTSRGGFLLTTSVLVLSLFASGILWSLFAKDLGTGNENLELSTLVAPIALPETVPLPEPVKQVKPDQSPKTESEVPVRQVNMARVDEPIVPIGISTVQNTVKARPNTAFRIGTDDVDPVGISSNSEREGRTTNSPDGGIKSKEEKTEIEEAPPSLAKKIEPKVETPQKKVSLGVINGKAKSLPVPVYPPPAKAVHASGEVNVQVTIDEKGNVISANAVSGHALLRQASEIAARSAKFTPTLLSNQPVKVTGIIVYKFSNQ